MRLFDPARVHRRETLLVSTGWLCAGLAAAFAILALFDSRTILGADPWIKPFKFAVSFVVYGWTVAWLAALMPETAPSRRWVRTITVAFLVSELFLIALQSARGVPSHFNTSTPFDSVVYEGMRIGVVVNMVAVLLLLGHFCRRRDLPTGLVWGIRGGLAVLIVGTLEGIVMAVRRGHAVAAPEDGLGLPVLQWSTMGGDLRIAHFFGIHALQLLPLAGWLIDRWADRRGWTAGRRRALALAVSAGYFAVLYWLFQSAMAGRPLVGAVGAASSL